MGAQVLQRRGTLLSGAPRTNSTHQHVARWLLDNLCHEEAVVQLAQKLPEGWGKRGIGGTAAVRMGEALDTALDALEALPLLVISSLQSLSPFTCIHSFEYDRSAIGGPSFLIY
jgi:hypothetical protein